MKKLLLLFLGCLVALAASADVYVNVVGEFNSWGDNGKQPDNNGWTKHTGLAIGNKGFKIKVWEGSGNNGTTTWYSTGSAISQKSWIVISGNNDNNMTISGATNGQTFDVEWDNKNHKIYVYPTGESREETFTAISNDLYLRGSHGGNWSADNAWKFATTDHKIFTLSNVTIENDKEFKIGDSNWGDNQSFGGSDETNKLAIGMGEFTLTRGSGAKNMKSSQKLEGVDIVLNAETCKLTVTKHVEAPVYEKFALVGEFSSWGTAADTYNFSTEDGVVYTLKLPAKLTGDFKIWNGKWQSAGGKAFGSNAAVMNKPFELNGDDSAANMSIANGIPAGTVLTFTYLPASTSTLLIGELRGDDPVVVTGKYIYFHTKYDLERQGAAGAVPCAHIYKSGTSTAKHAFGDTSEKMERIVEYNYGKAGNTCDLTEKYTLWRYPIADADATTYDAVTFYYAKKSGSGYMKYDSKRLMASGEDNNYGNVNEDANKPRNDGDWHKYIYTTCSREVSGQKEYAQQTFLTFDDFTALDKAAVKAGGRTTLYLIGGAQTHIGTAIASGIKGDLSTTKNDEGVFYYELKGSKAWFKISWIQPKDYVGTFTNANDQRYWATFDLGLVSANISANGYPAGNYDNSNNGALTLILNKSVKYENYNQANWLLPETSANCYVIIDTHEKCHTATVTNWDPQQKLTEVSHGDLQVAELTDAQAQVIHDAEGTEHLLAGANEANGHVVIKRANYASGSFKLEGPQDADLSSHTVDYDIRLNGKTIGDLPADATGWFDVDFLPLSDEATNFSVRGEFKDKTTGLTFHSRTTPGTMTGDLPDFNEPTGVTVEGKFYQTGIDGMHTDMGAIDGHMRHYGVYIQEIPFKGVNKDLAVYGDYDFEGADFFAKGHPMCVADNGITGVEIQSGSDWSCHMVSQEKLPLFIWADITSEDLRKAQTHELVGALHAVYPFLYKPQATVTPRSSAAPRRAASLTDDKLAGAALINVRTSGNLTINAKSSSVVSGIDAIEAGVAEGVVEYYNLQGIRVAEPVAGQVYIVNRGGRVAKEMVK